MLLKIFLSLAGIGLMYYEKVVDENMTAAALAKQEYKASCDMKVDFGFAQQEFSCSTILKSDYAVGFGFLQNVNIYYLFKSEHKITRCDLKSPYLRKQREREPKLCSGPTSGQPVYPAKLRLRTLALHISVIRDPYQ